MRLHNIIILLMVVLLSACSKASDTHFDDNNIKIHLISTNFSENEKSYVIEVRNDGQVAIENLNFFLYYPILQPNGSAGNPFKIEGGTDTGRPVHLKPGEKVVYAITAPIKEVFGDSKLLDWDNPDVQLNGVVQEGKEKVPFMMSGGYLRMSDANKGQTTVRLADQGTIQAANQKKNSNLDQRELIKQEVDSFILAMNDTEKFKGLVSDAGVDVVRFFVSGNGARGKDVLNHFDKDQIPNELQFPVEGEIAEDLRVAFDGISSVDTSNLQIIDMKQQGLKIESFESLNNFWNAGNDLRLSMSDQTDEYFQVIAMDDSFVITRSDTDYGTGVWALFDKDENGD